MQKLGQIIMCGIEGTSLTEDEKKFFGEEKIGGVILFSKNYSSPLQLAELINNIQAYRDEHPLFLAVDQEGGRVVRFREGFSKIPPMLELARESSPKITYSVFKKMAEELGAVGINLNLAPVCDILSNQESQAIGDRAFGNNVEEVCQHVSAAVRGLQANNILSCAKHFPGHGNVAEDSHLELPIVKATLEELEARDIMPFKKAIKARVEFILMAHLIVECLDKDYPASLSLKIHQYLREQLKYANLIISDDMEMQAIEKHYTLENAVHLAMQAGTDVLIYRTCQKGQEALAALKRGYKDQVLSRELMQKKIKRIAKCKLGHFENFRPTNLGPLKNGLRPQVFDNQAKRFLPVGI